MTPTSAPPARPRRIGPDLSDPSQRRRARLNYHWVDHAILRYRWTNLAEVAPGVFRSNHPTDGRFRQYRDMGIRTVINLRGTAPRPSYLFEEESCDRFGLRLESVSMSARKAPPREQILKLLDLFASVERPFLMHCKSGADRAGFAAALYLMAEAGAPLAVARRQLSWRFLHFRVGPTAILDHILDLYGARLKLGPIGLRDWFATEYDHAAAQAGFAG